MHAPAAKCKRHCDYCDNPTPKGAADPNPVHCSTCAPNCCTDRTISPSSLENCRLQIKHRFEAPPETCPPTPNKYTWRCRPYDERNIRPFAPLKVSVIPCNDHSGHKWNHYIMKCTAACNLLTVCPHARDLHVHLLCSRVLTIHSSISWIGMHAYTIVSK